MKNNKLLKSSKYICISLLCTVLISLFKPVLVYAGLREGATNMTIMNPTEDSVYYYESPWNSDGTFNYFYYPIYDDPMYLSDEDFFGKWSETNNEWAKMPYFKYSEFPNMSGVEVAAKAGNYSLAKQELLSYYKKVRFDRVPEINEPQAATLKKFTTYLETFSRNVFPCTFNAGDTIGYKKVGNEWQDVSVDVQRQLDTAKGSYDLFNVMISSVDKYYTKAFVCSKESAFQPVLKAVVNGISKEFYVVKDSAIKSGDYADKNYGTEKEMVVEEHGTYHNYKSDTSRTFSVFDISELSSSDVISSAMVQFLIRTDAPRGEKELSFYWFQNASWEENSVTWNSFSDHLWFSCNDMQAWDYVTTNDPNIKGKVCSYHRDLEPGALYKGYAGTKDERFAYQYIRHMMALINGIGFSTDVMNSLDMSTHVSGLVQGMLYCIDSEYMTADRFTAMLKHCWILSDWQVNHFYGTNNNNWTTFATSSVYSLIARFCELSVANDWLAPTQSENSRLTGKITYDDGMCIELSINYIQTLLGTFSDAISISRITGAPIPYDDETYEAIYNTIKTLMNSQGPYSGFNLSDGYDTYGDSSSQFSAWYGYDIFNDSQLEYLATNGAKGKMPDNPTTSYPIGMRTFMRSGWGKKDLMLSFTNNVRADSSHGHKDALSIAMFAYGKALLTDQGYGALQTGSAWSYMKSPVQHNVVTVNDTEDYLTEGTVKSFSTLGSGNGQCLSQTANKQYDFTEYETELYTTSEKNQRSVTFARDEGFWIVTDFDVPNNTSIENTYAQHWHFYPGSNFEVDENREIDTKFSDVNVKIVPVENDEIDEVKRVGTWYSEQSGQMLDSEKAMILKSKKGIGKFTTIVFPTDVNQHVVVKASPFNVGIDSDYVNTAYFTINDSTNNKKYKYYFYHLNDMSKKQEVKFGEYSTDASTLLIRLNSSDEVDSIFIMDGTYVKSSKLQNEYLFKSKKNVESLSYKKLGNSINIASDNLNEDDLKNITIYTGGTQSAYFVQTDKKLNGKNNGGYVYFGEKPVVTVKEEENNRNEQNGSSGTGNTRTGGTSVTPVSSGSYTSSGNGISSGTTVNPVIENKDIFADVKAADWFYEAVKSLAEKKVIAGMEAGVFEPFTNITREQFTKMLVLAANINIDDNEQTIFTDVESNSWYKDYVVTAYDNGIVNGISSEKFGVGENITRQDAAVMISRIIGINDYKKDVSNFDDILLASDYAVEAITNLKSVGLITGYENKFNPKANISRAEAAVMINNMTRLMQERGEYGDR